VVALTVGQWQALCQATGTERVFTALEQTLNLDLTREGDRYRLRETIAATMRPWFAARTFAEVAERLDAARALWSRYRGLVDVVAAHRARSGASVLASVDQPGIGPVIGARSPLRWAGGYGEAAPAPALGQHTDEVLAEVLGLGQAELGVLHDDRVIAGTR
jgi:2-methylfumaryl-CoA isomerase